MPFRFHDELLRGMYSIEKCKIAVYIGMMLRFCGLRPQRSSAINNFFVNMGVISGVRAI